MRGPHINAGPTLRAVLDQLLSGANCCLKSTSRSAFFNIAVEDYMNDMLRKALRPAGKGETINPAGYTPRRGGTVGSLLVTYVDDPAVVVGRHQVPLQECSVARIRADNISLCRRYSGGGTVYHDGGNANFGFVGPRTIYNPQATAGLVAGAIGEITDGAVVPRVAHRRHDLWIGEHKLSGSAMRITSEAAYHHCTLLINSDLGRLGHYLKRDFDKEACTIESIGIASVRSPVTSLHAQGISCGVDEAQEAVRRAFVLSRGNQRDTVLRHLNEADASACTAAWSKGPSLVANGGAWIEVGESILQEDPGLQEALDAISDPALTDLKSPRHTIRGTVSRSADAAESDKLTIEVKVVHGKADEVTTSHKDGSAAGTSNVISGALAGEPMCPRPWTEWHGVVSHKLECTPATKQLVLRWLNACGLAY